MSTIPNNISTITRSHRGATGTGCTSAPHCACVPRAAAKTPPLGDKLGSHHLACDEEGGMP